MNITPELEMQLTAISDLLSQLAAVHPHPPFDSFSKFAFETTVFSYRSKIDAAMLDICINYEEQLLLLMMMTFQENPGRLAEFMHWIMHERLGVWVEWMLLKHPGRIICPQCLQASNN